MKSVFLSLILAFILIVSGWYLRSFYNEYSSLIKSYEGVFTVNKPLLKYSIPALAKTDIKTGSINIDKQIYENEDYVSYIFKFSFYPEIDTDLVKTTTGQINIPKGDSKYPLILMLRGYVDQEKYTTGMGTKSAAKYYAENNFITIAPDFLGYADSDKEAGAIFETRFQTYSTVLSLIKSLEQIDKFDGNNIFLWGHSNGGQIALTVLELTGKVMPATLWAPVSKPFPYSVLYYTDESADRGKLIRKELAKFERLYNVDIYSFTNYLNKVNSPILIHQGTSDDAVPFTWSDNLVNQLKKIDKDITYHKYPGADHNLRPSWDDVVERDVNFFRNYVE